MAYRFLFRVTFYFFSYFVISSVSKVITIPSSEPPASIDLNKLRKEHFNVEEIDELHGKILNKKMDKSEVSSSLSEEQILNGYSEGNDENNPHLMRRVEEQRETFASRGMQDNCELSKEIIDEIESYRGIVGKIVNLVVNGSLRGKTYDNLAKFTDTFGHRMTCSESLEKSIKWVEKKSIELKLGDVHFQEFRAPHWVRNNESLSLLQPREATLSMLGLGSSTGTPPEGITAEVIVVKSFEELDQKSAEVAGKIVLFNPNFTNYDETVKYRTQGASKAAKYKAVASLVRSVTPFSINSPHTGWQTYEDSVEKIPTACITIEDSEMLQRIQDRGQSITVHLYMGAQNLGHCTTKNTMIDYIGEQLPEKLVVVSGHLDSWDVGVGAMDDGGGVIISWMVPLILKNLGLRAKRTIRTILFSGEEQGLVGGEAYFKEFINEKENYQLLLESDIGTFDPRGLAVSGSKQTMCIMKRVLSLLDIMNTTEISSPMDGGPDISIWKGKAPLGSLVNSNSQYFWYHHSPGDTMEVEDSDTLDKCAALWAAVSYVVADMNITLST